MKKTVKTALAIAVVLIVTGMLLVAAAFLRGASVRDIWNNASVNMNLVSPGFGDLKGYTVCKTGEESFSPDEVKSIDLSWISGTVKLQPGGEGRITLKERSEKPLKDEQKLCWKLEKGTLSIRFCSALQTQMPDKDLVLSVPSDWTAENLTVAATSADVELRELQVEKALELTATSGDVQLFDCRCDKLDAGATSGSVALQGCECRAMALGSTSGSLQAESCRCDTLEGSTTSGSICVGAEAQSIKLGSTSGPICCEQIPAGCDVSLGSTRGTVKLQLKDTSDGQRIKIETTSGDVFLDVPGAIDLDYDTASGDMSGRLEQGGSGCPTVKVDTTSGDLILGAFR